MSAKNSNTTSDYIEWATAINLIHKLYRDGDHRMSLLVGCGVFFGTRISDTLQLLGQCYWMMIDLNSLKRKLRNAEKSKSTMLSKSILKIVSRL